MPKCSLFVRELNFVNPAMKTGLDSEVLLTEKPTAPGQLWKKGDWYFLTYLRGVKVKNFNAKLYDLEEKVVDSIRAVPFQLKGNKLFVRGSKGDIKEILGYLMAIALKASGQQAGTTINYDEYFKLVEPVVDLKLLLQKLEEQSVVENVKKIRLVKFEVKLGKIDNCIVKAQNYDGVKSALDKEPDQVFGIDIFLKQPEETSVYFDLDGQVRVASKADVNVEEVTIGFASII